MSNFEVGYCTYEEYRDGESGRLSERDLAVGGLYTVMFALDAKSVIPAAKYPSRVEELVEDHENMFGVKFTIMNADLAPDLETLAVMRNGYWLSSHSQGIHVGGAPVISGYFKESYYGSGPEQELQDMLEFEASRVGETDLVAV